MSTLMEMIAVAKAGIENLKPGDVAAEVDNGALLVDVREPTETSQGVIDGAVLAPRGMLEFHADNGTPYHLQAFSPERRVIVYCAAGSRSALAARSLQDLGYGDVAHLEGGIKAWIADGRPLVPPPG